MPVFFRLADMQPYHIWIVCEVVWAGVLLKLFKLLSIFFSDAIPDVYL